MNYIQLTRPYHPMQWILAAVAFFLMILSIVIVTWTGPKKMVAVVNHWIAMPVVLNAHPVTSAIPNAQDIAIEHRATEIAALLQRQWADSLLAIERVNSNDVTVLEFHPDYANASFTVHGEARHFETLSNYIRSLNGTGLVKNVTLMHENGISREHVDTIEFELKGNL